MCGVFGRPGGRGVGGIVRQLQRVRPLRRKGSRAGKIGARRDRDSCGRHDGFGDRRKVGRVVHRRGTVCISVVGN